MVSITIKVQELLDERGMSQKSLAEKTGIRKAAISEICNNMRTSINREHLEKIVLALGLTSIEQLMHLDVEND
ncbi:MULTISPECIES: helix-turn-helix domain-containing protein [Paenibacillus]|uniref:Transcriptional regulator n=1 Tax=Paenibacillus borealis TaxID=160799 RepID=A0ABX3HPL3_PAEBO|nr:helix-turn-helix transcriptional regulator [Paenibacillus borealis]OMD51877.1 transcriptional regulator [Paenibacillus borealis]